MAFYDDYVKQLQNRVREQQSQQANPLSMSLSAGLQGLSRAASGGGFTPTEVIREQMQQQSFDTDRSELNYLNRVLQVSREAAASGNPSAVAINEAADQFNLSDTARARVIANYPSAEASKDEALSYVAQFVTDNPNQVLPEFAPQVRTSPDGQQLIIDPLSGTYRQAQPEQGQTSIAGTRTDVKERQGRIKAAIKGDVESTEKAIQTSEDMRKFMSNVNTLDHLLRLVGSTGRLEPLSQTALEIADGLGIDIGEEARTRLSAGQATATVIGSLVGEIIKQYGAGTGLSDADRDFAIAQVPGLGKNTVANKRMLRILRHVARNTYARAQKTLEIAAKSDTVGDVRRNEIAELLKPLPEITDTPTIGIQEEMDKVPTGAQFYWEPEILGNDYRKYKKD